MTTNVKKEIIKLSLFYSIFLAVWTLNVYLESAGYFLNDDSIAGVIISLLNRMLTWTLPVFLLVPKPLEYLKLKNNISKGVIVGASIGVLFSAIRFFALYSSNGTATIDLNLDKSTWFGVIIFVGLSEEVVFRGYILQKIEEISNFWIANIITTILFVITHIPYWVIIKHYGLTEVLQHAGSVLWISLLLGYILKKTKSLWGCMVFHSFNNFMSIAIR